MVPARGPRGCPDWAPLWHPPCTPLPGGLACGDAHLALTTWEWLLKHPEWADSPKGDKRGEHQGLHWRGHPGRDRGWRQVETSGEERGRGSAGQAGRAACGREGFEEETREHWAGGGSGWGRTKGRVGGWAPHRRRLPASYVFLSRLLFLSEANI